MEELTEPARCSIPDCACPLSTTSQIRFTVQDHRGKRIVCYVCFQMFSAICQNQYFVDAQHEYIKEVAKIKRLRLGADYFG